MWNTINSGRTWHGEFLNRKKNGELYWEDAVIAPVTDPQGTLISYISVKVDITKRKNAENALRNSEERFRQLVTSAPDAVFGIDANGDIVFANHEAASLLGYDEDELIGKNIETLVPMELRAQHIQHRANYFAHPQTRSMGVDRELKAKRKNGAEIPVEINLSWSATEKGTLAIAHMRDVTQRKIAEAALRNANQQLESQLREIENLQTSLLDQAVRDPLTQLHNRRFLNEAIEQEFHHAQRASETLSVILLDIDHFKIINDTFGHLAGDTCLVMLANLIRQYIRKSDISCRYGGEEFLLLLPATNAEGATQYAERLRDLVAHQVLTVDGEQIQFTVSLGIASFPEDGASYTEIINKADDAMYMSKKAGRNRVTVWSTGVGGVQN
jgi:diguanylate cyclase (GGDEF)-like protein/PAS domain S-box-containing protein